MGMVIDEDKCDTCIHSWTDGCPLQKCWEDDYKYYEKQTPGYKHYKKQEKEKMGIKRLTYDVGKKHYCDYTTREIINRLAECEIMLEKIEQIVANNDNDGVIGKLVREVIEDGN